MFLLYLDRVKAWVGLIDPACLKYTHVFLVCHVKGDSLPRGSLLRLSPDEYSHAVLIKLRTRILDGAEDHELRQWLRSLLSAPSVFKRLNGSDEIFAEANSLRGDIKSLAENTVHTPRQMVYNIAGFKARRGRRPHKSLVPKRLQTSGGHQYVMVVA